MKKLRLFLLVLITLLTFSGCSVFESYTTSIDGIENFKHPEGYVELNLHLLPSDDFLECYKPVDAKYHFRLYFKSKFDIAPSETSLIVTNYDAELYEEAKAFCLAEMTLSSDIVIEYNNYMFIENTELTGDEGRFPEWTNMFAYNDQKHELVFMGFCINELSPDDAGYVCDNWGEFLNEYFSEHYDFSR